MASVDNKEEIDRVYKQLSVRADLVYSFVTTYDTYINEKHNYGIGEDISMVEVHTLTMISDNPGITVSELSTMWNRTKGAVSQNIAKLKEKGLIERKQSETDARISYLYTTESGEQLSTAHKMYDNLDILETQQALLRHCSMQELDAFYKVLAIYLHLFNQ